MKALERYLARATRGLWGRRRAEARQELASHVFERVRQLMVLGLGEQEAQRVALRELGEPGAVSRGLMRVHSLPVAAPALALALLAGSAGLLATRAAAQVPVPVPVYTDEGVISPDAVYLKVEALRAALAKGGVQMTGPEASPTLSASGLSSVHIRLGNLGNGTYDPTQSGELYDGFNFETQAYERSVDVVSIARWAADAGWPVRVSGWEAPELTIGPARLALGGLQTAEPFYLNEASGRLFGGACASKAVALGGLSTVHPNYGGISGSTTHTLTGAPTQPGGIYALAMPYHSEALEAQRYHNYYVAVAKAGPDGRLTFRLPAVAQHLRYVPTLDETAGDLSSIGADQPTYQDAAVRGTAILYPLNGTVPASACTTSLTPLKYRGTSDSQ